MRVLCVAEKPSIAKSVAQILSGGEVNKVRISFIYALFKELDALRAETITSQVHQQLGF